MLTCESVFYEGRLMSKEKDQQKQPTIGNNCVGFMLTKFDMNSLINDAEIDRNRNVGITSTLKSYALFSSDNTMIMHNAELIPSEYNAKSLITSDGYFNFCVPLSMLLGFCEDYKRVVVNTRHELILIQTRNGNNCIVGDPVLTESTLELYKIQWRMPHVMLNEINKLSMLCTLESGRYLSMSFRSWDLYEYPLLQNMTKRSWSIKTAIQLEKPRYVLFALQTAKKTS